MTGLKVKWVSILIQGEMNLSRYDRSQGEMGLNLGLKVRRISIRVKKDNQGGTGLKVSLIHNSQNENETP